MNLCKVYGCNYKTTHITETHNCSNCGLIGHGKVECGNSLAINFLNEYNDYDAFSTIVDYINDINDINDIDVMKDIEIKLKDGEFTSIHYELGSQIFIRKVYKDRYQYLFMQQVDWGQYDIGIDIGISRKLKYDHFVSGYREIKL